MKLNAEELAAKRYITMPWEREDDRRLFEELNAIAIRERDAYAAAITEVAQPLQDRVEELEAALKSTIAVCRSVEKGARHIGGNPIVWATDGAVAQAEAILAKHA